MEIDFAPSLNPSLFGSLSISPPTSMFESFSPLLHLNNDFLDGLNPSTTDDDDVDDWLKPLSFDQLFDDEFQLNLNDIDFKQEENKQTSTFPEEKYVFNSYSQNPTTRETDFVDFYLPRTSEQQLPSSTTLTTTTVRLIHQAKLEPNELPTTLFVNGNEFQFHPILTNNSNNQTLAHSYTTTTSSLPIQSSIPIVPARVLKGKKFKRGGRVTGRGTSRTSAATKRRLNSTAAEPKASVVIIAEDATRIDSKTTTLGLSSSSNHDCELLKSSSNSSARSSTRRRMKSAPREVILFRNGTFISKEPITKQQTTTTTTTLCFETSNAPNTSNTCPSIVSPLHSQQITATGLQAAAQIVACNVLRQATLNDALIEQLIKREPNHSDDDYPLYCYSTPSSSSTAVASSSSSACSISAAMDEYENNCSTTLKILGCNTTAPLTPTTSTTTIELLTLAALQQQQQQQQQQQKSNSPSQICYIKQEPLTTTTTTTTTTFLLPRLLP